MTALTFAARGRRIATLTALRDALDAEIKTVRGEHTAACLDEYAERGTKSWDVSTDSGEGVAATFTVPVPKTTVRVDDADALMSWGAAERPELVEVVAVPAVAERTERRLAGKAVTVLTDSVKPLPDGSVFDPESGEVIPGLTWERKPATTTTLRFPKDGREALLTRWRDGLAPEMESAVLPAIGRAS